MTQIFKYNIEINGEWTISNGSLERSNFEQGFRNPQDYIRVSIDNGDTELRLMYREYSYPPSIYALKENGFDELECEMVRAKKVDIFGRNAYVSFFTGIRDSGDCFVKQWNVGFGNSLFSVRGCCNPEERTEKLPKLEQLAMHIFSEVVRSEVNA